MNIRSIILFPVLFCVIPFYPWGWSRQISFSHDGHKVFANSSNATFDAFVKALADNNYTVCQYIRECLYKKRCAVMRAVMKEWGITQQELQEVATILRDVQEKDQSGSYDVQMSSDSSVLPPHLRTMIMIACKELKIPRLNVVVRHDNEAPFASVVRDFNVGKTFFGKLSVSGKSHSLILSSAFLAFDPRWQQGALLHELAGHIKHVHIIEENILQALIFGKTNLTLEKLKKIALWKKLMRMHEREADWYGSLIDIGSAQGVELATKYNYELYGDRGGTSAMYVSNKRRYQAVCMIRQLLEAELRLVQSYYPL